MSIIDPLTSGSSFDSPTIHPEGSTLAYWWNSDDGTTLRLHDFETGEVESVTIESEVYSPSGGEPLYWRADRFITQNRPDVFWFNREGDLGEIALENERTWLLDVDSTARQYLYLFYPGGGGPREDPMQLRIYDSETETRTTLSEHPEQWGHAGFSPDEQRVAYRENPTETFGQEQIVIADTQGNRDQVFQIRDPTTMTELWGWHPDGHHLFVADRTSGWYQPGLYDWQSDETTWFGSGEYNEYPLTILPDGESIVTTRFQNGKSVAVVYRGDDKPGRELELADGVVNRLTRQEPGTALVPGHVLLEHETATRPPRLLDYDLATDEVTTIVDTQTDALAEMELVEAEHVSYESTDGLTVNAVLHRAARSPSPAVVKAHGGPTKAIYRGFDTAAQFLARNGYTVLQPNYRGSTDQDRDFQEAIRGDSGEGAVDDVAEGGRWLANKDWVDGNRLAVYGHSAGAYNAAMQAIRHPDLWQVAIPQNGFLNRVESLSDPNQYALRRIIDDPDVETQEGYLRKRSPVHRTEDIGCPVYIIQGEDDPGLEMSEDLVAGLEERGWTEGEEFRFVVLEGEGHQIGDKERLWNLLVEVLEKYLSDR